jgi:hypothetical protein
MAEVLQVHPTSWTHFSIFTKQIFKYLLTRRLLLHNHCLIQRLGKLVKIYI